MKIGFLVNLSVIVSLVSFSVNVSADSARIHNCSGYNLRADEWHTIGACKKQLNIEIPKNQTTLIKWGSCQFDWAKFSASVAGIGACSGNYTPLFDKVQNKTWGDRDWYIYANAPIIPVQNALTGGTTNSAPYAKFYIWVLPEPSKTGQTGLYATSPWINTATGQVDDAGAKAAGFQL